MLVVCCDDVLYKPTSTKSQHSESWLANASHAIISQLLEWSLIRWSPFTCSITLSDKPQSFLEIIKEPRYAKTSIYTNADKLHDAASCKIANSILHAKLNNQAATLQAIIIEHFYTDLSVISTYIYGKPQTPLGQFVVDVLHKQVCNKYTRNQTNEAWPLVYQQCHRWQKQQSNVFDIVYLTKRHSMANFF